MIQVQTASLGLCGRHNWSQPPLPWLQGLSTSATGRKLINFNANLIFQSTEHFIFSHPTCTTALLKSVHLNAVVKIPVYITGYTGYEHHYAYNCYYSYEPIINTCILCCLQNLLMYNWCLSSILFAYQLAVTTNPQKIIKYCA